MVSKVKWQLSRIVLSCAKRLNLEHCIPDKQFLQLQYRWRFNKRLDLNNPLTFSEKLQWLKLYDRKPEYTMMVDKYAVKKYVADLIGEEYIIPTLGVWEKPEDIEWDNLPDQFVLKCTHDSGGLVICHDKTQLNKAKAIKKLNDCLKVNYYWPFREWPYKKVKPRVIAEKYIEPEPGKKDLPDYKFFCFDGVVKGLFVATERQNPNEEVKFDFFDADFNHLPFRQGHDHAIVTPKKPKTFEAMKEAASILSKGLPHARIDFYEAGDKVLFGEITFFHFSGLVPFEPDEWDCKFGEWIKLPQVKRT